MDLKFLTNKRLIQDLWAILGTVLLIMFMWMFYEVVLG